MGESANKLKFPRLRKVVLRSFSLFSCLPKIEIEISDGVFCLAGANGLGKSTFLAAINYGLTGVVPNFNQKFLSVEEYYDNSIEFCKEFFSGRIEESDREAAEIYLEFSIGEFSYSLTRGMFEPQELRTLEIYNNELKEFIFKSEKAKKSTKEVNNEYITNILKVINLESFDQLVFLQHFIFTFDERRHLLFWDQKVLEQALHLAFGVDSATAKKADSLRREVERAASLGRNSGWQASEIRKKISELRKKAGDTKETSEESKEEIFEKYEKLNDQYSSAGQKVERLEAQIKDENLKLYELNSKLSNLRVEYDAEFNKRLQEQFHIKHHPLIVSSIEEEKCVLCGSSGKMVVKQIKDRINMKKCPLCESPVEEGKINNKIVEKLQQIDQNLMKAKMELEEVMKIMNRLNSELKIAREKYNGIENEVDKFESQNREILSELKKSTGETSDLDKILNGYRLQMEEFLKRKDMYYEKRNQKKKELQEIQKNLEKRYFDAETEFVPIFKELALMFLGIDLDIRLELSSSGLNLVIELRNTMRRQQHQLSESQRFFIDIALRMALAQYISHPVSKATLFIDTPEGSLDVAYESRAGHMFALFVNKGFDLIMTANINSSRMIRSLAEQCGKKKMSICRMTEWTELSEVQIKEEKLFEEVFKEIEQSLSSKKS